MPTLFSRHFLWNKFYMKFCLDTKVTKGQGFVRFVLKIEACHQSGNHELVKNKYSTNKACSAMK
jgi:hypothetical protein